MCPHFVVSSFLLFLLVPDEFCDLIEIVFSSPEPNVHWWAYNLGRSPSSSVVLRRRPSPPTLFKIFSSETTGPIKVKFHQELSIEWDGETKGVQMVLVTVMTKMDAMTMNDKNL